MVPRESREMEPQRCPFCCLEKSRIALENDAAVVRLVTA
jgi:hypothetical protein